MRKYHLSYDVIDCRKDFENDYGEARRYLLCVIANTPYEEMHLFNESALVIHYPIVQPRLFSYLEENLTPYFHYIISLVACDVKRKIHFIDWHDKFLMDYNFQEDLKKLECSNLGKTITNY